MKKKVAFLLTLVMTISLATTAFAAKSSDQKNPLGGLIVLAVLVIGGFLAWALHTPASVKESQRRQKERSNNIQKAITEASTNRLGIVMLSFAIGHYATSYVNGQSFTYFAAGPDSANGWSTKISIINSCGKTIKYVHFHTKAVNSVGDLASVSIGNAIMNLDADGPIAHGSTGEWHWDHYIYSTNLSTIRLESVTVDYMDGTNEEFPADKLVWRTN